MILGIDVFVFTEKIFLYSLIYSPLFCEYKLGLRVLLYLLNKFCFHYPRWKIFLYITFL